MNRSNNAEEVRADYIQKMGQELGELFHVTSSELTWIHWRWGQYRALFGVKPSRVDLLNESASVFFHIVQEVLFESTLLSIARFVGPVKSSGQPNLTVERFPPMIADQKLRDQVSAFIEDAKTSAEFAIDWRNRHIAHRDLNLVLKQSTMELAPATRKKVEESLSALRDVLNCIEKAYCDAHTAYDFTSAPGDAEGLLFVIRDGLLREKERQEKWERGERHEDDINPLEPV